jgi:hypothetical protein
MLHALCTLHLVGDINLPVVYSVHQREVGD